MYAIIEDEAGSLFYKEVIVDLSATVEKSGLLVLETIYINEENKYFDLKESDYIKDIKKQYGYLNWLFEEKLILKLDYLKIIIQFI